MTTTNNTAAPTAHAHCDHEVTKAARAKCRKIRGAAYNTALAARRTKIHTNQVIEQCSCKDPVIVDNTCYFCDRPTNVSLFVAA